MIDEQAVIAEMQSLQAQQAAVSAQLHRIEGALQMCRHLLAARTPAAAGEGTNGEPARDPAATHRQ